MASERRQFDNVVLGQPFKAVLIKEAVLDKKAASCKPSIRSEVYINVPDCARATLGHGTPNCYPLRPIPLQQS